jgi:hypothetical protein
VALNLSIDWGMPLAGLILSAIPTKLPLVKARIYLKMEEMEQVDLALAIFGA